MNVVATAPIPGSRMPSLPSAGLTPTPFLRAMGGTCPMEGLVSRLDEQPFEPCRIVRHDAVGAELEEARGFGHVVDGPEVDAQTDGVALRDERGAIEAQRTCIDRNLCSVAGERQLAPDHRGYGKQRSHLGLRERGLTAETGAANC